MTSITLSDLGFSFLPALLWSALQALPRCMPGIEYDLGIRSDVSAIYDLGKGVQRKVLYTAEEIALYTTCIGSSHPFSSHLFPNPSLPFLEAATSKVQCLSGAHRTVQYHSLC